MVGMLQGIAAPVAVAESEVDMEVNTVVYGYLFSSVLLSPLSPTQADAVPAAAPAQQPTADPLLEEATAPAPDGDGEGGGDTFMAPQAASEVNTAAYGYLFSSVICSPPPTSISNTIQASEGDDIPPTQQVGAEDIPHGILGSPPDSPLEGEEEEEKVETR